MLLQVASRTSGHSEPGLIYLRGTCLYEGAVSSRETEFMSFGEAIQTVFRKYAEFMGRAGRAEFWWWALFNVLVASALGLFKVIGIGDNASLGSLLAGLGASRFCCRASRGASDDFATLATHGAGCSFSWSRLQVASSSSSSGRSPPRKRYRHRPPRPRSGSISSRRNSVNSSRDATAACARFADVPGPARGPQR